MGKNKNEGCGENCHVCQMGVPCKLRNFIYHATCQHCSKEYVGASARKGCDRMKEYESGIRLPHQNERTTLGRHKGECHSLEPNDINSAYKFKILGKGKDGLDTFLREGIFIKQLNPELNGKFNNGFIL